MQITRRDWMTGLAAGIGTCCSPWPLSAAPTSAKPPNGPLRITGMRVTPIALPDPPLLAASGCHGPYFLRNVIELETDAGVTGIGETHGGEQMTAALEKCRDRVVGGNAFSYRRLASQPELRGSVYAGFELACLDAIGRATGRRLCELLGGPVRDEVEFASYLFFRYAADHPAVLDDPRTIDKRGAGDSALDQWGDVRTPETMAELAVQFQKKFGFRVHKLKAGVFRPELELDALRAMNERFDGMHKLRIDPNGRWTEATAIRMGKQLQDMPLEYYEDPVSGQAAMARVRTETGLVTSTNSCVTQFRHIADAVRKQPIDVVLGDHHGWGGITAFQSLGTIARALGWGLSQHSNNHGGITMAAMIHVGAITPHLTYASDTHYVWLVEGADIIDGPNIPIRNGKMAVPERPGVGVDIDQDKLAKAHEDYRKSGMRGRKDGETMQLFQPGWRRTRF